MTAFRDSRCVLSNTCCIDLGRKYMREAHEKQISNDRSGNWSICSILPTERLIVVIPSRLSFSFPKEIAWGFRSIPWSLALGQRWLMAYNLGPQLQPSSSKEWKLKFDKIPSKNSLLFDVLVCQYFSISLKAIRRQRKAWESVYLESNWKNPVFKADTRGRTLESSFLEVSIFSC